MREVPEWWGKNDDAMPPTRVRIRIFEAHGGRCYLSGRKITPSDKWALDHIIALVNGGENRERNLAPILADRHKEKSRDDLAIKSKIARVKARHLGIKAKRPWHPNLKKKLNGEVVPR